MERQIEAGSEALVTDLVNCVLTDDWKKSLHQYLDNNAKACYTTILRQAMNTAIRSAVETSNSSYFDIAETFSKLIFDPLSWDSIIKGDLNNKKIDQNKKWSWEAYFDYDIKRRKKLDAEQRLASMKALYNAKRSSTFGNERMLNLFRAKHYPKVLFTLLKLGADPFETKLSKKVGYHVTLTYAIVTSKTLTKVKRLHLLHHLSEKNLLRADQCGPSNLSPVQICLQDRTRKHALRYVIKAGGIETIQFSNGNNILQELSARNKLEILLPHATVDQFKKLLKAHGHYLPLYTLRRPGNHSFLENLLTAIKELILENRNISVEKLVDLVPEEFLAALTTNPTQFVDARKLHWSNKVNNDVVTEEFNGNTEFPFEHLPVEISEMICANLKASDQAHLMAVNKALNKLSESFGEYFWRSLMKNSFPVAYSSLENDTSSRTWHEKFKTVSSSVVCTANGRFSSRTMDLKCPSVWQFDEYWLCAGNLKNLTFWNCIHDQLHNYVMPQVPWQLEFLDSTSDDIPGFVARTSAGIYWSVNKNSTTVPLNRINGDPQASFIYHVSLLPLSSTRFGVQRNIFDIELDKVVGTIPTVGFKFGKKHIVGNCIIGLADQSVIVYDEHMRETQKSARDASEYQYINILDEHLVYLSASNISAVMDLRMMQTLHKNAKSCSQFTNGAYRTITSDRGIGTVWNLKDNTWESSFILPNGTNGNPILNSRYAVFKPYDIRLRTGSVVLDFYPRNNNKDA